MSGVPEYFKTLNNKRAAVFGLGASGLAVVRALSEAGAKVLAFDDRPDRFAEAEAFGAQIVKLDENALKACAFLVLAPGVPLTHNPHPVVDAARAAGIEVIGDIELFYRCYPDLNYIAVTGTNGKSTTVSLLQHIFGQCGVRSILGGNIGKPVFDIDMSVLPDICVLELSSYQLDLCVSFRAKIAALLNITPDHLDRHGDMEGYAAAKRRIFRGCEAAIIGVDDNFSLSLFQEVRIEEDARCIPVSVTQDMPGGVYARGMDMFDATGETPLAPVNLSGIPALHGAHNMQNMIVAYTAAKLAGGELERITAAIRTFPGLAHRQFPVRRIGLVSYINDSKATNAEAAGKALAGRQNIFWIAGGKPKDGGLDGLGELLSGVKHTFLIGEAAEDFARWLERHGAAFTVCRTLERAVEAAHTMAQASGHESSVLLSPACASFDQFASFEDRGRQFEVLVKNLPEGKSS